MTTKKLGSIAKKGVAMSRFAEVKPARPKGAGIFKSDGEGLGEYAKRAAQYVPGEILAPYLAGIGVVAAEQRPDLRFGLYLLLFAAGFILTPLYFHKMTKPGEQRKMHLILSTTAFVVWAYSLGGFFSEVGIHFPIVSSVLLLLFSMVSGVLPPREKQPEIKTRSSSSP